MAVVLVVTVVVPVVVVVTFLQQESKHIGTFAVMQGGTCEVIVEVGTSVVLFQEFTSDIQFVRDYSQMKTSITWQEEEAGLRKVNNCREGRCSLIKLVDCVDICVHRRRWREYMPEEASL